MVLLLKLPFPAVIAVRLFIVLLVNSSPVNHVHSVTTVAITTLALASPLLTPLAYMTRMPRPMSALATIVITTHSTVLNIIKLTRSTQFNIPSLTVL